MIYEDDNQQQEQPQNQQHISYKEYKQNLGKKQNESLVLFVSAFFVMLMLFLGIAKKMSPDIDVNIADNNENVTEEEFEKGNVDDRLKSIQMEDNSYAGYDETFSQELEEKVILPKQKQKTTGEQEGEAEVIVLNNQHQETKTPTQATEQPQKIQQPVPVQQNVNAKVVVGYYATAEQAEVAKGIIQDAGLNIQPFVKQMGGAYTLQVGSFSTREKAQNVANDLLRNNFPARVIIEN